MIDGFECHILNRLKPQFHEASNEFRFASVDTQVYALIFYFIAILDKSALISEYLC